MMRRAVVPSFGDESWFRDKEFGVFIDAGSSGSRLLVYAWKSARAMRQEYVNDRIRAGATWEEAVGDLYAGRATSLAQVLPVMAGVRDVDKQKWYTHVSPGLSAFADDSKAVGDYLAPLLEFASTVVPKALQANTPIYLYGTAGLRLLSNSAQQNVLDAVCGVLSNKDLSPFLLLNCSEQVKVITGEWEGIYGWLAVNYLGKHLEAGSANHGPGSTVGFTDMGGASTQLCFEPVPELALEHANDLSRVSLVLADGTDLAYNVWVKTWLGHGVNEARKTYARQLLDAKRSSTGLILDPCLPVDLRTSDLMYGTGELLACMDAIIPLLNHTQECSEQPCLWNGVHAPLRPQDLHKLKFVGVSEYWYANEDIHDLDGVYEYETWASKVNAFCQTPWNLTLDRWTSGKYPSLLPLDSENRHRLELGCFRSAWVGSVIWHGLGVPRDGFGSNNTHHTSSKSLFTGVNKLNGLDISWTLGAMLHKASESIRSLPSPARPSTTYQALELFYSLDRSFLLLPVAVLLVMFCYKLKFVRIVFFLVSGVKKLLQTLFLPVRLLLARFSNQRAGIPSNEVSALPKPLQNINFSSFMHHRTTLENSQGRRRAQYVAPFLDDDDEYDMERNKLSQSAISTSSAHSSSSPQLNSVLFKG